MKFPEFESDEEMGDWFEENDIDPSLLEPAPEVTIAEDVRLVLEVAPPLRNSANTTPDTAITWLGEAWR